MVGFIPGADRSQPMLLPAMIEDYIDADCAVRVIDAYVASLDLHKLGFEALPAKTGRPGFDPADMLKLYIYGYLNALRSSRKLEKACRTNLEIIWLLRTLAPDYKTIADFRRDNHTGIVGTCRAFVQFCREANLFAVQIARVTVDGTKLRAAASRRRVMSQTEIAAEAVALDRQIGDYLLTMNATDEAETDDRSDEQTEAALKQLKARRSALIDLAGEMALEERDLGVLGETEARPMGAGKGAKPPSYNVQTAVDPASHIIVHHAVTTEATDNRLLQPMAHAAKAVLGVEALEVIADAGYANASQAAACEAEQITPAVPTPRSSNTQGDFYAADVFLYDAASNSYTCPAGRKLLFHGTNQRDQMHCYRAVDCSGCPLKQACTRAQRRYVYRHVHHDAMQRSRDRVKADKSLMTLRRSTVEHPFATLKAYLGNRFLLRGTLKAGTEVALAVLGYNLMRAIRLLGGCQALIARLA
jgi:transposase